MDSGIGVSERSEAEKPQIEYRFLPLDKAESARACAMKRRMKPEDKRCQLFKPLHSCFPQFVGAIARKQQPSVIHSL